MINPNEFNGLNDYVTPVTPVTRSSKVSTPAPIGNGSTSEEIPARARGPLSKRGIYGVGNPPDFVSGQVPSLVNR